MPSTKESTQWFIRITAPHSHLEIKIKELKSCIDVNRMAIGYHIGDKTKKEHVHIAIEFIKVLQQQSVNKRIKKLFEVSGADYSSKIWDGSHKVLSYLYHDEKGRVEFWKMELSPDQMSDIQRTHEVYKEIVTTAKAKASTRIPERILSEIEESGRVWTMREIITRILKGVKDNEWYPPGIQMERIVQEIRIKQDPDTAISELTDYYMERFTLRL